MFKIIYKFLLKRSIELYNEHEYIKPAWKVVLVDGSENFVTSKYSCYSIDYILREKILEDSCLKVNNKLIIPMSQIKEIILTNCDKFVVHTHGDWLYNRKLCWYNTLEELQEVDQYYQNKLLKYNSL
jgi:hypothetical protein